MEFKLGIEKNVPCDENDQTPLDARFAAAVYSDNANRDGSLTEGWTHTGIAQDSNIEKIWDLKDRMVSE